MVRWDQLAKKSGCSSVKAFLTQLYVTQDLSTKEIGEKFKVTSQTVRNALRRVEIPFKTRGEKHEHK